jgi:site-specific DNA-methyltransferase (adenine-specific)
MKYFIEKKKCNFNILCWCKDNPVPFGNSPFLSDIEYCLVFYESGAIFNQGCENKHKWYLSSTNQKDKKQFNHPTIKPLDFVKMNLLNSTKENDVVLDCFMGSGTTAVACKQLNRHYIGFELNPEYYQIAIDRVNGLTVADRKKKEAGQLSLFDIE